jgi:hypothetical protein
VFASWSAGEYGSVGATEWLEVSTAQTHCVKIHQDEVVFPLTAFDEKNMSLDGTDWTSL